jgi:outer membrane lipoprotein LolB
MATPAKLPLASALLVLLLAACAGQQPRPPTAASWEEHSARLQALTHWTAEGKLALRSPEQSESASIRWQQEGDITRLYLSGPLGVAATSLYSDGRSLVIRRGEEVSTWALDDTEALELRTGWDLPLQSLPYWIKGIPAPGLDIQEAQQGPDPALLLVLRQDGWEIHYEDYANYGRLTLPTMLHLKHQDTTVRLIIRNWQVLPD